jgi:hypothetical protein
MSVVITDEMGMLMHRLRIRPADGVAPAIFRGNAMNQLLLRECIERAIDGDRIDGVRDAGGNRRRIERAFRLIENLQHRYAHGRTAKAGIFQPLIQIVCSCGAIGALHYWNRSIASDFGEALSQILSFNQIADASRSHLQ